MAQLVKRLDQGGIIIVSVVIPLLIVAALVFYCISRELKLREERLRRRHRRSSRTAQAAEQ
jgi:large-conductance mechanosensitive channel